MRRVVAALSVALALAACTIMNDQHLDIVAQPDTPGDPDTTKDGGTIRLPDGAIVSVDGGACVPRHAPKPPAKTSGPGTPTTIVVALRRLKSKQDPGDIVGLDLDNLCTCNKDREACKPKGADVHCDAKEGIDNASAEAFSSLVSGTGGLNIIEDANTRIASGFHGNVFKIDGYNGLTDDDAVVVTWMPSPGLGESRDLTQIQEWPIARSVASTKAWVTGKTLVAEFATIDVLFLDDTPAPAKIVNATMTGPITDVGGKLTIGTALIVGRVNTTELVGSVGELEPPGAPTFGFTLCKTPPFAGLASSVCPKSDLPAQQAQDGTDSQCTAMSMSLSLELMPATIGGTQALPVIGERCADVTAVNCN